MFCKLGACKAIEVADTTANSAFLVEVILAITLRSDVLIKRAFPLASVEFAQNVNTAKLAKVAVKAALARGCLGVDLGVKLVNSKLTVGVASKKADECFPARCFISLFSHLSSP